MNTVNIHFRDKIRKMRNNDKTNNDKTNAAYEIKVKKTDCLWKQRTYKITNIGDSV